MIKLDNDIKEITLRFHNTYEELAKRFNYETRSDTKEFDFNSNNGKLMYATVKRVIMPYLKQLEDIRNYIKHSDLDKMLWGKELMKILDRDNNE